ncbi:MAG: hypothetical protein AUJ92_11700 [Armatimonadetes bacterium CG2_30_59_28]|nr:MAG: hypothetical protein AUJ92_11700 [Armatimonadetes bacterium CG2_30_59_28]PIU67485.1 MAG: hypothetical protein COS85_00610 [Armatimonadetes bacterium CG07_land_8_20_14_0_80_59_28]PIX39566.1 MAG: hypothetical protein COZ56_17115 [Armatimonadetes bacterium CG_4_8_14_3_um_filter_58_9]PJB68412.1 MAG: hypothetical protein CO095_11255 [Armatimonadetes bacterium CG_4_9_14_3_um_filter_58_7]
MAHGINYLVRQYAESVTEMARRRDAPGVNAYGYFETRPETSDLVPDGILPNPEGHRVICELLAPVVCQALRQPVTGST